MEYNNQIVEEIKDFCPVLARLQHNRPFSVPASYFASLTEVILPKINSSAFNADVFTSENPYSTPAGYFENLSGKILHKVLENSADGEVFEEMEAISPLLNKIKKTEIYSVPEGYFSAIDLTGKQNKQDKPKLGVFGLSRKIVSYAVAAVVIALLGVGIFVIGYDKGQEDDTVHHGKTVSEVKKLSEQEIENYLKTTSPTYNVVSNSKRKEVKDTDIEEIVNQMSEKEIKRFLEENGEQDEM